MTQHHGSGQEQGIIMHACPLTRCGLQCFFMTYFPEITFRAVGSFDEMNHWPELTNTELVVSDVRDGEKSTAEGISWLLWLHSLRSNKPTLVITEALTVESAAKLCGDPQISLVLLQTPEAQLRRQVEQVMSGHQSVCQMLCSPSAVPVGRSVAGSLTEAEWRVLTLLHSGYSVTQIAMRLCRSVKTVSSHKRHLMDKLRVNNEVELFARMKDLN